MIRYHVAAWYPGEGHGGVSSFDTEAEALGCRRKLIEIGGYKSVDVWASASRWVVNDRESVVASDVEKPAASAKRRRPYRTRR